MSTTIDPNSRPVAGLVERQVRPSLDELMTDLANFVFYRDLDKIEPARAAIREHVEQEVAAERERCASKVPNNWCDPLLTGPQSLVRATDDCQMVERLLRAIAARIRGA